MSDFVLVFDKFAPGAATWCPVLTVKLQLNKAGEIVIMQMDNVQGYETEAAKVAYGLGVVSVNPAIPTADEQMGMTWWNGMSQPERLEVLGQANALISGASIAQAWRLWKAGRISMSPGGPKEK